MVIYKENPIKIIAVKIKGTLNKFPIPREEIREMSDMLDQLAERDSKAYTSENLKSLMRLAEMHFAYKKELGLNKQAVFEIGYLEWIYLEALEICDYLIKQGKKIYYPSKAKALEKLAEFYSATGYEDFAHEEMAMWAYEELLTVYQQLEKRDLNKYKYATAKTLLRMSEIYEHRSDLHNASEKCFEAIGILKNLVEKDPDAKIFATLLEKAKRHSQHLAYKRLYNAAMNV